MNALVDLYAHEPAVVVSAAGAVVAATLVLVVSFGVPITEEQRAAINALVVVIVPIVAGFLVRSQVTPVASSVAPPPH